MRRMLVLIVLADILLKSLSASAAEYVSPKGYSLHYPDGWTVSSESQKKDNQKSTDEKHKTESQPIDVTIRNPRAKEFSEYFSVTVNDQSVSIDAQTVAKYAASLKTEYKQFGIEIKAVQSELIEMNDVNAISVKYEYLYPNTNLFLHQWQVVLSQGGKTYTITFSALKSEFQKAQPVFQNILDSVKFPVEKKGLLDNIDPEYRDIIIYALIFGGIGGAVGGLIGAIKSWKKPRQLRQMRQHW
jgi:hypothetical protein